MHGSDSKDDTRERLLDAAERLFCEKGFDRASVRDLTLMAGCNVAAINYYFGGKDHLYCQMLRRQVQRMIDQDLKVIDEVMSGPSPCLEDLLRRLVAPNLQAAHRNEAPATAIQLMVREVLNQHVDAQTLTRDLKEVFLPRMAEAIRHLVPGLDNRRSELLVFSLDAMIMHPLLFMPYYMDWVQGLDVEGLIDHVVQYTAAAIRGLAEVSN